MDAQEIIYKRIELYNEELEKAKKNPDMALRGMKEYLIKTVLQELDVLLIEFQE